VATNHEQWFAKAAFATIALVKSCFGDISNVTHEHYEIPSASTAVAVGTLPKVDWLLQRIALDGPS
jgi:phenylpyruvate tautomerase PptA (4-oxalocrotonate tautomerase family)